MSGKKLALGPLRRRMVFAAIGLCVLEVCVLGILDRGCLARHFVFTEKDLPHGVKQFQDGKNRVSNSKHESCCATVGVEHTLWSLERAARMSCGKSLHGRALGNTALRAPSMPSA